MAQQGEATQGLVWLARFGKALRGTAGYGLAGLFWQAVALSGLVCRGIAR